MASDEALYENAPQTHSNLSLKRNYIAGEWVAGESARPNVNPSDLSDIIGEYAQADVAQTKAAIAAAHSALPDWSTSGIQLRSDVLERVAGELLARRAELGDLLAREEGKTLAEATAEVVRAGQIFRFFAGEVLRQTGHRLASVRPGTTSKSRASRWQQCGVQARGASWCRARPGP